MGRSGDVISGEEKARGGGEGFASIISPATRKDWVSAFSKTLGRVEQGSSEGQSAEGRNGLAKVREKRHRCVVSESPTRIRMIFKARSIGWEWRGRKSMFGRKETRGAHGGEALNTRYAKFKKGRKNRGAVKKAGSAIERRKKKARHRNGGRG